MPTRNKKSSRSFGSLQTGDRIYKTLRQASAGPGSEIGEVTQKVIKERFLSSKTISGAYKYDVFIVCQPYLPTIRVPFPATSHLFPRHNSNYLINISLSSLSHFFFLSCSRRKLTIRNLADMALRKCPAA